MNKWSRVLPCVVLSCLSIWHCSATPAPPAVPAASPRIERRPRAADYRRGALASLPAYDPKSSNPFQVDLRSRDLSRLDLSDSWENLRYAAFDDRTTWPPEDRLPKQFDRKPIVDLGKNPELGVRRLHERGIAGRGVSIAIIDQPLLTEHQEYAGRLELYEEIHVDPRMPAQMHGPAVASIAVGKTVGVAPEATLYYIASWTGDFGEGEGGFTWDFRYYAQAVRRVLEINEQLPEERRIRVIAMQVGWNQQQKGYDEITAAVEEAKAAGMHVVSSSIEQVHGFKFHGLGRHPLADPDAFESYEPGLWWAERFYAGEQPSGRLLLPMDSRTTASPTGDDEYVFYRQGGWSWAIPYLAGAYALAVQVDAGITPERFWSLALKTGRTIELEHQGKTVPLGPIIDPGALVGALENP